MSFRARRRKVRAFAVYLQQAFKDRQQHPDQLALVKETPALMDTCIEELLRYNGPLETLTTRWAYKDVKFQGHLI